MGLSSYDAVIQAAARERLEMLAQGVRRESPREVNASFGNVGTGLLLDGKKTTIWISNSLLRILKVQKEKMCLPSYDAVIQAAARERLGMPTGT